MKVFIVVNKGYEHSHNVRAFDSEEKAKEDIINIFKKEEVESIKEESVIYGTCYGYLDEDGDFDGDNYYVIDTLEVN